MLYKVDRLVMTQYGVELEVQHRMSYISADTEDEAKDGAYMIDMGKTMRQARKNPNADIDTDTINRSITVYDRTTNNIISMIQKYRVSIA